MMKKFLTILFAVAIPGGIVLFIVWKLLANKSAPVGGVATLGAGGGVSIPASGGGGGGFLAKLFGGGGTNGGGILGTINQGLSAIGGLFKGATNADGLFKGLA